MNNQLFYKNNFIKNLEYPIHKTIDFESKEAIVVLLDRDYYKVDNQNVLCVDFAGVLLWQVPKFDYFHDRSPFVNILNKNEYVQLINWDSSYIIIEPKSGEIIVTPDESMKGRRAW